MKYYLHDTNAFSDEKVTKLFMKYGYEGLGLFFTILEKLAFHEKPMETKVLKKQLFVDVRLRPLWKYMVELGLLEERNGETFNKRVLNVSDKYISKRTKDRQRLIDWRADKGDAEDETRFNDVSKRVRNVDKENNIKEKERKENDDVVDTTSSSGTEDVSNNNIILSFEEGSLETLKTKLMADETFADEFGKMGLDTQITCGWLGAFNRWLAYTGENNKTEKDYRKHFKCWLLKQPYKTQNPDTYNLVGDADVVPAPKTKSVEDQLKERYGEGWDG